MRHRSLLLGLSALVLGCGGDVTSAGNVLIFMAIDGNTTTSDAWIATEYATSTGDWATEIGGTRFP